MATEHWVRHWSRGASNGIGMSDAKTSYRSGVCIGNWVEADAAQELAAQATFARFTATTTVQDTYRPEGRYGNAMLLSAVRQDLERQHACTGREMLFKHGGMGQPPVSCYASLKGLTDAQVLELRQPKVENFLWIGQKRNDSQVPLSDSRLQRLLASKMQQWKADRNCPRFTTTSKDSMDKVAHLARGHMTKQPALAPSSAAEGGQGAQIGRKAKGPCSATFDASWRKTGLRQ